jgi:hypothetical protein
MRARARRSAWLAAALFGATIGSTGPAAAYVRTHTDLGAAMCWCTPTSISMLMLTQTAPSGVDAGLMSHAADAAADAWSHVDVACSSVNMRVLPGEQLPPVVANDGSNRVFFRTDSWNHESGALAITSVFAIKQTGRIVDTDVEVNGVNFNWGDLIANPDARKANAQDIQNTLTHEFGHVLGLDHPCTLSANAADSQGRPFVDDMGRRVPTCSAASATIRESTMFASVLPGDTDRRTLADDDVRADCDIYPFDKAPQCNCTDAGGTGGGTGGCAYALGQAGAGSLGAALLALVTLGLARRRFRRPARAAVTSTRR